MDLKETGYENLAYINLIQDRVPLLTAVNTIMSFLVP
jgi:hypothetical protein